jgi:Golgi nucleoside diphosphatase
MSENATNFTDDFKLHKVYKFESFWKEDEILCGFDATESLNNDGIHHNSDQSFEIDKPSDKTRNSSREIRFEGYTHEEGSTQTRIISDESRPGQKKKRKDQRASLTQKSVLLHDWRRFASTTFRDSEQSPRKSGYSLNYPKFN